MLDMAAFIQETESVPSNNSQQTQSYEIEKKILGIWEANLMNIDVYYGCEFYADGTFVYLEIQDNEWVSDAYYTYEIISEK